MSTRSNPGEEHRKCPSCAEQILKEAKKCKHCGETISDPKAAKTLLKNFILVMLSLAILFTCFAYSCHRIISKSGSGGQTESKLELKKDELHSIQKLEKEDLIRIEGKNIYFDPILWNRLDLKAKEALGRILAIHCTNKTGDTTYWANILDKRTGKKLAKYSHAWGFSVE